jgi:hypothetical protein
MFEGSACLFVIALAVFGTEFGVLAFHGVLLAWAISS